jgi:hypothetical protein
LHILMLQQVRKQHEVMQGRNQERNRYSSQLPLTLHKGQLAWPLMAT